MSADPFLIFSLSQRQKVTEHLEQNILRGSSTLWFYSYAVFNCE